jgi:hypothetical protein
VPGLYRVIGPAAVPGTPAHDVRGFLFAGSVGMIVAECDLWRGTCTDRIPGISEGSKAALGSVIESSCPRRSPLPPISCGNVEALLDQISSRESSKFRHAGR